MALQILMLGHEDIITEGDWCRPLHLVTIFNGPSDDPAFDFKHGEPPQNNMKWVKVEKAMPAWLGKTVAEYTTEMEAFNRWEFIRGEIFIPHIHENAYLTEYERHLYSEYLK